MRRTIVAALTTLLLLTAAAPAAEAAAYRPRNVYNNSDHGMWMIINTWLTGPYRWVPAKTWSRDVGVMAVGVYTGSGYCTRLFRPAPGGWAMVGDFRGARRIETKYTSEWMVEERPC